MKKSVAIERCPNYRSETVEGALGGFAGGIAAAVLLNYLLGLRLETALIVPLAILIPLAAQLGDLA